MNSTLRASMVIETSAGTFVAHYSARGLAALDFPVPKRRIPAKSAPVPEPVRQWHALTTGAVKAVLGGRSPVEFPPLDLTSGTEFQRRVWEELTWIPCGETRSYAEIAKAIGKSRAARAVGGACGANPIPLLIPCHRVLAANGKIGGFSGGLEWKRKLLQREGVATTD